MRPDVDRRRVFSTECVDTIVEREGLFRPFMQLFGNLIFFLLFRGIDAVQEGLLGDERRIPNLPLPQPGNSPVDQLMSPHMRLLGFVEPSSEHGRERDKDLLFVPREDGNSGKGVDVYEDDSITAS